MEKTSINIQEFLVLKKQHPDLILLDVREPWEYQIAHIPHSILVNKENYDILVDKVKHLKAVVVVCHHGVRSLNAVLHLRAAGVGAAVSLSGGINAYSMDVDPSIPQY